MAVPKSFQACKEDKTSTAKRMAARRTASDEISQSAQAGLFSSGF
jgi:hypothetical protein